MQGPPRLGALVLCGVSLFAIAAAAPVRAKGHMTEDFRSGKVRPIRLALLPPRVVLIREQAGVDEKLRDEARRLERSAAGRIVETLRSLGYEVRWIADAGSPGAPGAEALIATVNRSRHETWVRMMQLPSRVRRERLNMGDESVRLSTLLGVDGLLIARIDAAAYTRATKFWQLVGFGDLPSDFLRCDVSVIEGATGDVEGYFLHSVETSRRKLLNRPADVLEKCLRKALRRFPAARRSSARSTLASPPGRFGLGCVHGGGEDLP